MLLSAYLVTRRSSVTRVTTRGLRVSISVAEENMQNHYLLGWEVK